MLWEDTANRNGFRKEEGMILSINLEMHHLLAGGAMLFLQSMMVS